MFKQGQIITPRHSKVHKISLYANVITQDVIKKASQFLEKLLTVMVWRVAVGRT